MQNKTLIALALALSSAPLAAQEFSPFRSITAFTEIADDYYNEWTVVTDLQELDTSLPGTWDEAVAAEVTLGGSVTYADAGQWSWVDPLGSDFESDGFAAGGLYNQLNGEMRSESLFQADFLVLSAGSVDLSYDLWFGNSFGGLTSHDRPGQSIAEMRVEDSLGNVIFSESSTFEDGDLSNSLNVPLGPGQYKFIARAEIFDATTFTTVVGSMTVAGFYVEGTINGGTPVDNPPSPPSALVATAGDGTVDLDWAENGEPDLDGYLVYRALSSGGPYSALTPSAIGPSAYSDTSVTNGTTYFYVVTAVDVALNESGFSNEASATPADTLAPAAPVGLTATAGDGVVDLDWADNGEPDLDGYLVYRSLSSGGVYTPLTGSPIASSAYSDTSVSNGTTYYYIVTAVDLSGNQSAASNEVSATPTAGGPTVLAYDDFESGFGNYTDGGNDCRLNTKASFAWEGSNSANIQDNSGVASSFFLTNGIDVDSPGYTQIDVNFHYITKGLKNNEDFFVQYFDGSIWHTVATFVKGIHFSNGVFYETTVVINEGSFNFPSGMKIRFMCDASGNRDDVFIDAITVSAQ